MYGPSIDHSVSEDRRPPLPADPSGPLSGIHDDWAMDARCGCGRMLVIPQRLLAKHDPAVMLTKRRISNMVPAGGFEPPPREGSRI